MMSGWFGASNSALDEQIERATGSSLEDMALNLEISDIIRSKTVQPREAMRSLKRRIGNKNPNTQLSALNLTDTCVKNGGAHFLAEIASREFLDNLVSLLKASGPAAVNEEVSGKILDLIQNWATATEGRSDLSYLGETYRNLQREAFKFPPKLEVSSTMVDSSAPPEWTDSDVCMRCRTAFSFTNRKHHCRNCGNVFDQQCSAKSLPLPHLGILQSVRVDDGCYEKLTNKSSRGTAGTTSNRDSHGSHPGHKVRTASTMQPRSARVDDGFDEDLKRALAMSLEQVNGHSTSVHVPGPPLEILKPTTNGLKSSKSTEDDDDDLKAAIAASLADMEEQKRRHAAAMKQQSSTNTPVAYQLPKKDHELTPVEAENINLFSTLVDRLQSQPPGTILREPQIQELYDSIGTLRPKLARTYGETMSKHDTLLDLHSKLSTVVRYYDRMLEDRMSHTYGRHSISGFHPQTQSGLYPSMPSSVPSGAHANESFYTGQVSHEAYDQPQHSYQYPHEQYTPQYHQDPQMSAPSLSYAQPDPRRQILPPTGPQRTTSYSAIPAQNRRTSQPPAFAQAQVNNPSEPAATPSADPNASFYYNNPVVAPQNVPDVPPVHGATVAQYPVVQSPRQYHQIPPQTQQAPTDAVQQLPTQPQQAYWQQSQAPQAYQAPAMSYEGYTQESFPAAPHHVPQPTPVAVEESLIEL